METTNPLETQMRSGADPKDPADDGRTHRPAETAVPNAPEFSGLLSEAAEAPGLRKGERTRRRILWATAVGLRRTSFALLSMDTIAEIAGISRAALYQYFASKEDAVRAVLTDFNDRTLAMSVGAASTRDPREAVERTNRYYIDYFARNAVFMERIRELREIMPDLITAKQEVNRRWAQKVGAHVARHRATPLDPYSLRVRVMALECMIDDVLREIWVIANPDFVEMASDLDRLSNELSGIWFRTLYVD
jgi:AcrR family transcriptional regulator